VKKFKKGTNGITLIALIITIIILILLVGITISSLTGSGLFQKAQEATKISELKEIEEFARISYMERQLDEITEGKATTIAGVISDLKEKGYTIKEIAGGTNSIIGIALSEEDVTLERNTEKTITYTFVYSDGTLVRYFVEVDGKDYEITFNNGEIKVNTNETNLGEMDKEPEVTLTSSNNNIIEAKKTEEGKIVLTAKNEIGDVTITIKETNSNVTKTFTATTRIPITSITLSPKTIKVDEEESAKLSAIVEPSNTTETIIWSSSDTDIATVSNDGTIMGKRVGKTIITATYGEIEDICNVTITTDGLEVVWTNETTANRTIDEKEATYQNPIIPVGFSAVNTEDTKWNKDNGSSSHWNNGLVIKNLTDGNEFVWIPIDGTNVKYERWCTSGRSYSDCTEIASTTGLDIVNNVSKYGGFWVARYEAGLPATIDQTIANNTVRNTSGKPLSIAGAVPWNFIDWNHAKENAEKMYSNGYLQSGLINGTQWDTIMKWLQNEGINVTNSVSWGNYTESSISLRNKNKYKYVCNFGTEEWLSASKKDSNQSMLIKTGASDATKAKNIYDLAGNLYEWTDEYHNSIYQYRIARGGAFSPWTSGVNESAVYRVSGSSTNTSSYNKIIGFRVQLYIK